METDDAEARAQLTEFENAVDASVRNSVRMPSWWAFPLVASMGPALILGFTWRLPDLAATPDQPLRNVFGLLSIVLGAIAAVASFSEWKKDRANPVRPSAPIRGGRTSKWVFASTFSGSFAVIVGLNMLTIYDYQHPIRLAIGLYLWMATVPIFFYRRHVMAVRGE